MPIRTALWTVGPAPTALPESELASERLLEDMIVSMPRIVADELMLIGRQEDTGHGGRIDLLGLRPDGSLVLIELKRGRTPREVVAQALDYGAWVRRLRVNDVVAIYNRFSPGRSLAADFQSRFGQPLDDDTLDGSHEIIIVAASLDDGSERIVEYLSDLKVPINVLCFQVFTSGETKLLSRAWLLDPVRQQTNTTTATDDAEPWNGEVYVSFGESESRSWQEAVRYGFICGGGGPWFSRTLRLASVGDRIWVKVPGAGFVGVGRVTGGAQRASDFTISTPNGDRLALSVLQIGSYHREFAEDPDRSEYFVPVKWLQTVPLSGAVQELGMFGNQNTMCKPTTPKWRSTVERLKQVFPAFSGE